MMLQLFWMMMSYEGMIFSVMVRIYNMIRNKGITSQNKNIIKNINTNLGGSYSKASNGISEHDTGTLPTCRWNSSNVGIDRKKQKPNWGCQLAIANEWCNSIFFKVCISCSRKIIGVAYLNHNYFLRWITNPLPT